MISTSDTLDGMGTAQRNITYGSAGDGGNGGDGGNALARLLNTMVAGSAVGDTVFLSLTATGGTAGIAGTAGTARASSSVVEGTSVITTTTTTGAPAGLVGLGGTAGSSTVVIRNLSVDLGAGDDALTIYLLANGPGAHSTTFSGNTLIGGLGTDTLILGNTVIGRPAAVVNVQAGTLKLGAGMGNTISGFEVFQSGTADDRFIDGTGNQSYNGGLGADTFVFTAGRAGADRIETFAALDVIRLAGFGPGLDSFAEVLAATTNSGFGALIQTSSTSSILLPTLLKESLLADDFTF